MGKLRFVALCLAVAACGGNEAKPDASIDAPKTPDAKVWNDAPPGPTFDFTCMGNTAPTTADANITLTGSVQQLHIEGITPSVMAVADASLKACVAGAADCDNANLKGTATSAADGSFSIGPITTGGTPLDVYIEMTKTNTRTTFTYPASPFTAAPPAVPMLTFTPGAISVFGALGCNQDDGNGIIALAITDCADDPISDSNNIDIVIKQNGTEVSGTGIVDLGALNDQAAGTFLVCNVPPAAVTNVGATYKGKALRAHDVKVVADANTATILRPGY
jgi:hypothetical protein